MNEQTKNRLIMQQIFSKTFVAALGHNPSASTVTVFGYLPKNQQIFEIKRNIATAQKNDAAIANRKPTGNFEELFAVESKKYD